MTKKISITAFLAAFILSVFYFADIDYHLWSFWQNKQTTKAEMKAAIWLPDYQADLIEHKIPGIDNNASGITFNHDSNTLWVIVNEPALLVELDLQFNLLRRIELKNFDDTEAVAYIGDDLYVIGDERTQTVILAKITDETRQLDKKTLKQLKINIYGESNKGLEGIAVEPASNTIYTVRERNPLKLLKISGFVDYQSMINIEIPEQIEANDLFLDDLSGLHFDSSSNHLLILSDESKRLAEIDLQGHKVSYMELDGIPQAEGVTMDNKGNLYIVSEPDLIYRYIKKN